MKFKWDARAGCDECGITYTDVEPELIIKTDLGSEYIICPCCLKLIRVLDSGEEMPKKPIRIKSYHIDSMKILEEISHKGEEGKKRAEYIKHAIRVKRAEMRLGNITF